jgi:hypothetical protein
MPAKVLPLDPSAFSRQLSAFVSLLATSSLYLAAFPSWRGIADADALRRSTAKMLQAEC